MSGCTGPPGIRKITFGPMVERLDPLASRPPAFGEEAARQVLQDAFGLEASLTGLAGERDENFRADTADGRRTYTAIGKAVGLSVAGVRQRVQRLVSSGVIQIVAVTDPMTLGFHRQTMIGIKCGGDLEQVADQLAEIDELAYVVITSGSLDLLAEVVCEDDDHLLEILGQVREIPAVTSTETFVYLKLRKQTYSWGTR